MNNKEYPAIQDLFNHSSEKEEGYKTKRAKRDTNPPSLLGNSDDDIVNYQFNNTLVRDLDDKLMEGYKANDYYVMQDNSNDINWANISKPERDWLVGGMMAHEIDDDDFENDF